MSVGTDSSDESARLRLGGQSTIEVDHDHATAVTYCLAHYIKADGRGWSLTIESIHYLDGFVKRDGGVGVRRADAHGRLG
jgi:hypothetical protein